MEIKLQDSAWDGAQDGVEALLDNWAVAEKAAVKKVPWAASHYPEAVV